jgi:DNA topoisomerase
VKSPKCGVRMVLRNGKNGSFWGCSDYPTCHAPADDDSEKPVFSGIDTISSKGG